jgi:hypothetical protein
MYILKCCASLNAAAAYFETRPDALLIVRKEKSLTEQAKPALIELANENRKVFLTPPSPPPLTTRVDKWQQILLFQVGVEIWVA